MPLTKLPTRPDKAAQRLAYEAIDALKEGLTERSGHDAIDVAIGSESEPLRLPREALVLLYDILSAMAKGRAVSVVPLAAELTTQAAAEMLGCSRPHLVKLLEAGEMAHTKVGRHRRVRYEDVVAYAKRQRRERSALLSEMMADDEAAGLYDTGDDPE